MAILHVLRVFTDEDGSGGNPLGVFLDGAEIPPDRRQEVAADLGFSETVFVDDPATGEIRIFTPVTEVALAGHPLVGTAWLLARERTAVPALHPPAGEVPTWPMDEITWIRANPEDGPPFELRQLGSPEEVDELTGPPDGHDLVDAWAWIDEHAGSVRSRVFPVRLGIPEDEATGAAALRLAAAIGRPIEIRQGRGSVLLGRPGPRGLAELGGRVELEEVRPDFAVG